MRLTKKQMVKDIFFLATEGSRTLDNYVEGMDIIDAVAENNYRSTIQRAWDEVSESGDRATARRVMSSLGNITAINLGGVNGPTARTWAFRKDLRKFNF